jgi:hypothetical protein
MTTFDKSYSQQATNNWRTVTFTIPYELHLQLLEIVSGNGRQVTAVLRELLAEAVQSRNASSPQKALKPTDKLFADLHRVRERRLLLNMLAEIKGDLSEEDFKYRCQSLGFVPSDVNEIAPQCGAGKKKDRLKAFLRILFYDRDGLPMSKVLALGELEGFGRDMTYDVAHECGYFAERCMVDGKGISILKPPPSG